MNETQRSSPFGSLQAMRALHRDLLKRARAGGPDAAAEVEAFLARGVVTGASLDEAADRDLAQGLLDYWQAWGIRVGVGLPDSALREFDPDDAPELPDEACPYVGLDAFGAATANRFHGRTRLVDAAIRRLKSDTFLAILGPSGSGKSSVVLGGILPRLRTALPPETRFTEPFVPGLEPLVALARSREEAGTAPAVYVVDQFEELFALCDSDADRRAFIEALLALADDPARRNRVIVTMRTDFETYVVRFRDLWERFLASRLDVPPLTLDELREAIVAPAAAVGLVFESGIPDKLADELVGQPSSLPLVQFALRRLWDRRRRNRITWVAYDGIGGGLRALERAADELYDGLVEQQQRAAKRILLRLVRPGDGLEVTRTRVLRRELFEGAEAPPWVEDALARLVAGGLVRVTGEGDSARIEISHEALVRNWPRFIDWVAERREELRARFALSNGAQSWNASGQDARLLLRGPELRQARAQRREELSSLERAFLEASKRAAARARGVTLAAVGAALAAAVTIAGLSMWAKHESDSLASAQLAQQKAEDAQIEAGEELVNLLENMENGDISTLQEEASRIDVQLGSLRETNAPQDIVEKIGEIKNSLSALDPIVELHLEALSVLEDTASRSDTVQQYVQRAKTLQGTLDKLRTTITNELEGQREYLAAAAGPDPPDRASHLVRAGEAALALGDRGDAREKFLQALTAMPENVEALTALGNLLAVGEDADLELSEKYLARAVERCASAKECVCGRARWKLAEVRPEEASRLLDEALEHLGEACVAERTKVEEKRRKALEIEGELELDWVAIGPLEATRTEVTVAQYEVCVQAGVCEPPLWEPCAKGDARFEESDRPVTCLDGARARKFALFAGGRIPTDQEWAFVARSGEKDERLYPWGDAPPPDCTRAIVRDDPPAEDGRPRVSRGCGKGVPAPPCSRPDGNSPAGMCDLIGNVDEIVEVPDKPGLHGAGGNWFLPVHWMKSGQTYESARIGLTRPIGAWLPANTAGLRLVRDRQPDKAPAASLP